MSQRTKTPNNIRVRLNKWRMRTGQRSIHNFSMPLEAVSTPCEGQSQASAATAALASGESIASTIPIEDVDNTDPEKVHLRIPKKIGRIKRWASRFHKFWKPPLTPAELELQEQTQRNMRIRVAMYRQMMIANKRIPMAYANLGIEYQRKTTKDKYERSKPRRVRFSKWQFSSDGNTVYGKVCSVPYGFSPAKLVEPEVLTALSVALGHPVGGKCGNLGEGVIIYVSLAGTMDIPDMFSFSAALPLISESAPPLTYFVGAGENGSRKTYNLEELPHLLIGGSTGSGKSVALVGILSTFIARNTPETVRLLMADLKRMELVHFEGTPHLITDIPEIPTGIVVDDKQIIPMLKWLEAENNRRQALFAKERIHNLAEWNRRNRVRKMPRIVVAIDELARLMRNAATSKEFVDLTYDLASTARATGIYLIMATQFAKDKYITTDIKMNVPGRMAFSVPDLQGSISMIDNGDAVNLYPPPGRGIFMHGVNRFKFQSPFISTAQIAEVVRNAKAGKTVTTLAIGETVTYEDIVKWALTENNGFMQAREAFREFSGRIEWNELVKMLGEMDDKVYPFGDAQYRVTPPAGQRARQLEISTSLEEAPQAGG
jgi:hypothetical protein